jgi:glyoxalase-like protein
VDIDHVILGVSDLARGIREFEAMTGVAPRFGGRHPLRDTQNCLANLGPGRYLEILAPANPSAGSNDPRVQYPELTFSGWALQTSGIDQLVAHLRAAGVEIGDPAAGARQTPEGTLLQWKTAAPRGPGLELAPFFIEWSASTTHPSTGSPAGCRLDALDLEHPDPRPLQALFAVAGVNAALRQSARVRMTLTLECPNGRVTFAGR